MQLSPEDIAAAEACGVTFLPATAAQVQRLAMQRKVFYAADQPILATRGDGFYETVGTLQRVIEEGLQQQRDLAAWQQQSGEAAAADPSPPVEEPNLVAEEDAESGGVPHDVPPKRERQSRRAAPRILPAIQDLPVAEPEPPVLADPDQAEVGSVPRPDQPGRRWLMAGAARRGRAGKHWSTRQR